MHDIKTLTLAGHDIIVSNTGKNSFFYGNRYFEMPEIKILIEAVSSSHYLTHKPSVKLIEKLSKLNSHHNAEKLLLNVNVEDEIKSENTKLLLIVELYNQAVTRNLKIRYKYYDFTPTGEQIEENNGEWFYFSPYGQKWNGDRYYMIGYSDKEQKIVAVRASWVSKIEPLEEPGVPAPEGFSIASFTRKTFFMYDGEEQNVVLRCRNHRMREMVDRF